MDERLDSVLSTSTLPRSARPSADTGGSPANHSSEYASSLASTKPWRRASAAASSSSSGVAVAAVGLLGKFSHSSATPDQSTAPRSGRQPRPGSSGSSTTSAPAKSAPRPGTG